MPGLLDPNQVAADQTGGELTDIRLPGQSGYAGGPPEWHYYPGSATRSSREGGLVFSVALGIAIAVLLTLAASPGVAIAAGLMPLALWLLIVTFIEIKDRVAWLHWEYEMRLAKLDSMYQARQFARSGQDPRPQNPTHLSEAGLGFISGIEGLRTKPYNDAKTFATIGVGHLLHCSPVTKADLEKFADFTAKDAAALLRVDASRFEHAVSRAVKVPIRQHQFDGLCSFAFNVGEQGMAKSAAVKALNGGHADQVPALLHKWDNGNLLNDRRTREGNLFAAGVYK